MGDSFKVGKASAAKPTGVVAPVEEAAPENALLTLVPPAPAPAVDESQAGGAIKLDPASIAKLDVMVADYVVAITQMDVRDPKFRQRISDIQTLGDDDIKAAAAVSSRLLARPVGAIKKGSLSNASTVGANLVQLRRQIDLPDPGHQGDLFGTRRLLGLIPFGDRLQAYPGSLPVQPEPHQRHRLGAAQRPGDARRRQPGSGAGESEPLGDDGAAAPVHLSGPRA